MPEITTATGPPFFVAEITALQPGTTGLLRALGWNGSPWNTLSLTPSPIESTATIYASDMGYVTRGNDPNGIVAYPPVMTEAFALSREVPIEPGRTAAAWGWGAIQLSNEDGRYDGIAAQWNADGRPVKIRRGFKAWDDTRGIWVDPSYNSLLDVFIGVATPWFLDADKLTVPVRDSSYWIEKPLQADQYNGAGLYNGTVTLAGKPRPKTRGGTAAAPVQNISPILLDPTWLIYQYNDAPGTVVRLYEGGAAVFTFAGDVADLYLASTPQGQYRTNNARGLFQLGSSPVHTITADVTGAFLTAGIRTTVAFIAYYLLTEDMALPPDNIDAASFSVADVLYPYTAGFYFHPDQNIDGATAVSTVLESFGAKLIPNRIGQLRCFVLRALSQLVSGAGAGSGGTVTPFPSLATGTASGVGTATGSTSSLPSLSAGTASGIGDATGRTFSLSVGTAVGIGVAIGDTPSVLHESPGNANLAGLGGVTARALWRANATSAIAGSGSIFVDAQVNGGPFSSDFSADFQIGPAGGTTGPFATDFSDDFE